MSRYRENILTTRRDFIGTTSAAIAAMSLGVGCSTAPYNPSASVNAAAGRKTVPIRQVETLWIPMSNGRHLAAKLWLPVDAEQNPVPGVLEYLPYRRRDLQRLTDSYCHEFTASHGYACLRVDITGTGDSDGLLEDEYTHQERRDGIEIIEWIAKQSWCSGSIGMRGISWGGFNSLQIAAMAPPQLKAIIPHCASDDRFTDDAHYVGGNVSRANWDWGQMFMCVLSMPPDPAVKPDSWKEEWISRLNRVEPPAHKWLIHQTRDEYWQDGSVSVNYSDIKCPVYAVGGIVDSYTNSVPRLLEHLEVPCKGFIGPQAHQFPDSSDPGPAVGFLFEELRWWDHWLKGIDTGIMDEPQLQFFMPEKVAGQVYPQDTPGRWAAEPNWPSARIERQRHFLNTDGLAKTAGTRTPLVIKPNLTAGMGMPHLLPINIATDLNGDQAEEDRKCLIFDSAILEEDFEILGQPELQLAYSSDRSVAKVAVKLNEVLLDGTSWNVTLGNLNLTHRNGHEKPEALTPGETYTTAVKLNMTAHRFKTGSRVRLTISENHWPLTLPSPELVNLTVYAGESFIELPVRPMGPTELEYREFPAPPPDNMMSVATPMRQGKAKTESSGPDRRGNVTNIIYNDSGTLRLDETGTTMSKINEWSSKINVNNPLSASWSGYFSMKLQREGWDIAVRSDYELTVDADNFYITTSLNAREDGRSVFRREWKEAIPRNYS